MCGLQNLDKSISSAALYDTFAQFGQIQSCKIQTDNLGNSRGYGFVQFHKQEDANEAIEKVNGMLLGGRQVFVAPFVRRQDRDQPDSNFNNVYLKNLSEETTDEYLNNVFGEFGTITSVAIMRDADGKSKGFGFVNFEDPEAARESVEKLNGHEHAGKAWVVNKAQKKSEREAELRQQREQVSCPLLAPPLSLLYGSIGDVFFGLPDSISTFCGLLTRPAASAEPSEVRQICRVQSLH
jgi:polyadenylate-binding protein